MRQRTIYTAAVSHADLAATNAALEAVGGSFWNHYDPDGMFTTPLILEGDADDLDPPRYWATVVKMKDGERAVLKSAIVGPDEENPIIPSLQYQEVNSRTPPEDEALIGAFAAGLGYRIRGCFLESYGTGWAAGTADAQTVGTSPATWINQWTTVGKLINMVQQPVDVGQRLRILSAGTYRSQIRLYVEGATTFNLRAFRNATPVGDVYQTSGGFLEAQTQGPAAVDDVLLWAPWVDSGTAEFKLLSPSQWRVKRVS